MTDPFDGLIGPLLAVEGGYSDDAQDAGGATNFGITAAVAKAHGYTRDMKAMPRSVAVAIYRADYWTAPGFDKLGAVSTKLGAELFDTGVNMGVVRAGMFLQRALNALDGSGLKVDGQTGGVTLRALSAYVGRRGASGVDNLLKLMNAYQAVRYTELVEGDATQRRFINGWIANRIS